MATVTIVHWGYDKFTRFNYFYGVFKNEDVASAHLKRVGAGVMPAWEDDIAGGVWCKHYMANGSFIGSYYLHMQTVKVQ